VQYLQLEILPVDLFATIGYKHHQTDSELPDYHFFLPHFAKSFADCPTLSTRSHRPCLVVGTVYNMTWGRGALGALLFDVGLM